MRNVLGTWFIVILCAAACGRRADRVPDAGAEEPHRTWARGDFHIAKAVLALLRDRELLDDPVTESVWRRRTDARIRVLMAELCRGPLAADRVSIADTPIDDYFDLAWLGKAVHVRCMGLVVDGFVVPGKAFGPPRLGPGLHPPPPP